MSLYLTSTFYKCQKPLLEKINPKDYTLAVVTNASDGYLIKPWVDLDIFALRRLGFRLKMLDLRKSHSLEAFYNNKSINGIYVAGGNTFYLLELMKKSGFFEFLSNNIKNYLYIGTSAGSIVCCENIDLIKYIDKPLKDRKYDLFGLKIVEKLILPHFATYPFKNGYAKMFEDSSFNSDKVIKLSDYQALWIEDVGI